jgi:hypothetical protein
VRKPQIRLYSSDVSGISQVNLHSDSSSSSCSPGVNVVIESIRSGKKLIEDSIRDDECRRLLLKFCDQTEPEPFDDAFPSE